MKRARNLNLLFLALLFITASAQITLAAPYDGRIFRYRQPNGKTFEVRLWGDEFYAVAETLDGYVITRDPRTGYYCYARLNAAGDVYESTGVVVGDPPPKTGGVLPHLRIDSRTWMKNVRRGQMLLRTDNKGRTVPADYDAMSEDEVRRTFDRKSPPSQATLGSRVGLVLLIAFPDRPGDVSILQQEVDNFANQPGYTGFSNHGSVYDYFFKQSQGRLRYTSIVTEYYTAQHDRSYYADTNYTYGTRAVELTKEALNSLKADGFDFTKCDGNGDDQIDGVNTLYAGDCPNDWAQGIWPHRSAFYWNDAPDGMSSWVDYQITDMSDSLEIGTYCHENGHMLCDFPDLYDYGYESCGVGRYSLMASGGHGTWPRNVDSYLARAAGWCDTVEIGSNDLFRAAVRTDGRTVYRHTNPTNSDEYFLVYIRESSGYESPVDEGLIILHCDENGSNDNELMVETNHYECSVEQADFAFDLEKFNNYGGSGDLYHAGWKTLFHDAAQPDARYWAGATAGSNGSGQASGFYIQDVSAVAEVMTFVVGTGTLSGDICIGLDETQIVTRCDLGTTVDSEKFAVWNRGTGTLNYAIATNQDWLAVDVGSGTATTEGDLITISFASSGLISGSYTGRVTVSDASATNSPQAVVVVLNVDAPSCIGVTKTLITTSSYTNESPQETFQIFNSGGGTMTYTNTWTQSWLSIIPTNGMVQTEDDIVYLTFDPGGLSAGTYTDYVNIASGEATNSPQTVTVTYTVKDGPDIDIYGNGILITNTDHTPTLTDHTQFEPVCALTGLSVRTFSIVNSGNQPLLLTGTPVVALSGTDTQHFSVTTQPDTTVAVNGTNTFSITYAPQTIAAHTVTVSAANNTGDENPAVFDVAGVALDPYLDWVAYHDTKSNYLSHANVSKGKGDTNVYTLINFDTGGALTGTTIRFDYAGAAEGQGASGNPAAGTDAHGMFNGIINVSGGEWLAATSYVEITLSGLLSTRTYEVAFYSSYISDGFGTMFTLEDVSDYTNTSSTGVGGGSDADVTDEDVDYDSGNTNRGYLARWSGVQPAGDGGTSFKVRFEGPSGSGYYFLPSAIMIRQNRDPFANSPPNVNAGVNQVILSPATSTVMAATVLDDGQPSGITNMLWTKQSGPGTVAFSPSATIEDPTASFSSTGSYVLALTVDDGELTNSDSVTIYVAPEGILFMNNLDSDPGWTTEGMWAFGVPQGLGGEYGGADPTSGCSGSSVYGYNLAGDYSNNLSEEALTTPLIDCSGYTNITLSFQRWLNVEQNIYDHSYVRVSHDGLSWSNVWQNPTSDVNDTSWTLVQYDISSVADNQGTVYVRWVMGDTDSGWRYSGWNIDDIEVEGQKIPMPAYTLQIVSTYGSPTPTVGIYTNDEETILTNTVADPAAAGGTQFVNVGWSMAGHDPVSGTSNTVVMTVTNDAVLTWLWQTNVQFSSHAGTNGAVTGNSDGWYIFGGSVTVTAVPDSYYQLDAWSGDVPGGQETDNPLTMTMDRTRSVSATFAESLAGRGTPHWWLAQYGWTTDFDIAETNDPDEDGMPTWGEFVANTIPTNAQSVLRVTQTDSDAATNNVLTWSSASNRHYDIIWSTNLPLGFSELITNVPASPPQNTYTDTTHSAEQSIYYRIGVHQ